MTRLSLPHACAILAPALLLLAACAPADGAGQATATAAAGQDGNAEDALTRVPVTITQGSVTHRFTAEVAATPEEQRRGLMFRTRLAPDAAMLFPFPAPRIASFWMQNTLIPLDMLFIRADGSIDRIAENTTPGSLEPVASGGEVTAVLELAGGTAQRLGLTEAATVRWTLSPTPASR